MFPSGRATRMKVVAVSINENRCEHSCGKISPSSSGGFGFTSCKLVVKKFASLYDPL